MFPLVNTRTPQSDSAEAGQPELVTWPASGERTSGGSELAEPVCAVAHARVDGPATTAIPPTARADAIFKRFFNGMPLPSPRLEDCRRERFHRYSAIRKSLW